MRGSDFNDEVVDTDSGLSIRALLDEDFRAVFGGTTPETSAWMGLMFS